MYEHSKPNYKRELKGVGVVQLSYKRELKGVGVVLSHERTLGAPALALEGTRLFTKNLYLARFDRKTYTWKPLCAPQTSWTTHFY